jgi:hypothetical protein
MKHTLLSLATLSLTSLVGAGVGVGSWLALSEYETKILSNTKCQTLESMKPVTKETPRE